MLLLSFVLYVLLVTPGEMNARDVGSALPAKLGPHPLSTDRVGMSTGSVPTYADQNYRLLT